MNTSRCLGLVGGLGVGATIHYYEKLAKAHDAQGRTLDIVIVHAETSRVFEHVQADDRDGLAEYLTGYIRRLKAAGAEVTAIPAVTPHFCLRELIATSPLPLFNIFEPLVQELAVRAARRVAVFLTALAHTLLKRDGVDAIILAGTDLALLFRETNTDFPYIDCAALHLQAILKELLGETLPNSR